MASGALLGYLTVKEVETRRAHDLKLRHGINGGLQRRAYARQ